MKSLVLQLSLILLAAGKIFGQETPKPSEICDYGGKTSIGIATLDGIGLPVRFYTSTGDAFDLGLYLGGVKVKLDGKTKFHFGLMGGGGFTSFGNRFNVTKSGVQKVRANGMAFRLNYLTGDYATVISSIGWAQETFRKDRKGESFLLELGLRGLFPNFKKLEGTPTVGPQLRCQWNFFFDK